MSFLGLLNNTFIVLRGDGSSDGQGGVGITFNEIGTVKGRLSTTGIRGGTDTTIGQRWDSKIQLKLFTTHPTIIQRNDLIELNSIRYRVKNILEPSKNAHHIEIPVEEVQLKFPKDDLS